MPYGPGHPDVEMSGNFIYNGEQIKKQTIFVSFSLIGRKYIASFSLATSKGTVKEYLCTCVSIKIYCP